MSNENSSSSKGSEPWQRLWLPSETWERHRGIDEEFLSDYGGLGGVDHFMEDALPGVAGLANFSDRALLIMLGRPGAGKSKELEIAEKEDWFGENAIFIQGKTLGASDPAIYFRTVYGEKLNDPTKFVIDGLDEILLANPRFISQLKNWLKIESAAGGRPKHSIAISSRWADWPESEISDLSSLWPASAVGQIVLAPIRRADAVDTLRRKFGDQADDFWKQLHDYHLMPVACWPQGFLALVNSYEKSGRKFIVRSYAEAIASQTEDDFMLTDSRSDSVRWDESLEESEWRGRIAGRVAAAMAICGSSSFVLENDSETNSISASELSATPEEWEGRLRLPKKADFDALVKRTNLMRKSPGSDCWRFQSQVQQEWLAANWLAQRRLDISKLRQIFGTRSDEAWIIAPAMRSTAAWLAHFDKTFRKEVLSNDPLALLQMDGAGLPESERMEIVDGLLRATHEVRVLDTAIRQAHLPSLRHGKLKEQLIDWLKKQNVHEASRELAVEIADKTRLNEIAPFFWELYPEASKRLKIELARALGRLAREGYEKNWKDVISGKIAPDSHGTLLGRALEFMVVEKREIPVRDVLKHILPERRFEVFGAFDMVVRQLQENLVAEDLPAVFKKLAENPHTLHSSLSRYADFNVAAIRLAIQNFENPSVSSAFCEYWHDCLKFHVVPAKEGETIEGDLLIQFFTDDLRRKIAYELVVHPAFERHKGKDWVFPDYYLLSEKDFDWCLKKLSSSSSEVKWRFALLIVAMIWRVELTHERSKDLNAACQSCPELRSRLPIPEGEESVSECLERIKQEEKLKREGKQQHARKRTEQRLRTREERLSSELSECKREHDEGSIVWPGVFRHLSFRFSGSEMGIITFDPISAIGKNEDWMIEAASRFITEIPEQRKLNYDYALYGLLALAACKERIATDTPVSRALKGKWLEALMPLLCNHGLGGPPEEVSNERFAALFPQEFVEAFERFVKVRYAEGAPLDELSSLSEIPLQGLSGALEQTISNEPFNSGGFFNSVNFLANTNAEAAIRVLSKKITQLFPADSGDESVVILAAAMVLSRGLLDSDIEAYFKESELFTKALLYGASKLRRHDRELDFSKWPDNALKHLGEACWRSFHVPDRHRDRGSFKFSAVTAEDEAMEFRDAISSAAWKRGIDLDIPAFVEGENPEESLQRQHMIDWHRHTNRQIRVSYEWKPISLPQFLKLMEKPNARLARNQDELMEAIIQSLQRWEETLVNGKWHVLWNFQKIKHEKVIAREMADWLQRDLELQVDCETEPILDKRADLLVKIQPTDGISQCLQVVIEVKKLRAGNSRERKTAMKSQLLKNYLEPRLADGWTHGLFIVAWTPDPGSASDSIESLQLQSIELKKQAEELSVDPFTLKSLVLDCRYRGKIVKANEA